MVIIMKKLLCIFVSALLVAGVFGVTASASGISSVTKTIKIYNSGDILPAEPITQLTIKEQQLLYGGNEQNGSESVTDLLFNTIYDNLKNMNTEIDISSFELLWTQENINIVSAAYNYIMLVSPDLFMKTDINVGYHSGMSHGKTIIHDITVSYITSKEEYDAKYAEYKEKLDSIVTDIPQGLTDVEKVFYIYNYLALNFEYQSDYDDEAGTTIRDAYNFFTQGKGVCMAYSYAFIAIMNELGIESTLAIDNADNHAWNIVLLNDKAYHIDCTFADPLFGNYDKTGYVGYEYFLLSNSEMLTRPLHSEYTTYEKMLFGTDIICDDSTYESGYVWLNSTVASPFIYCDGNWYYMDYNSNTKLLKVNDDFKSVIDTEVTVNDKWYADASAGRYWSGYFGSIFTFGNEVCYSTPDSFRLYNPQTGKVSELSCEKYNLGGKNIYGCSYDGHGNIKVLCESSPNDVPKNNITVKVSMGSNAVDLAAAQKFILTGECDKNWGYFDVSGDIGIDIRDLVALKKRAASVSGGNSGEYFPGNW